MLWTRLWKKKYQYQAVVWMLVDLCEAINLLFRDFISAEFENQLYMITMGHFQGNFQFLLTSQLKSIIFSTKTNISYPWSIWVSLWWRWRIAKCFLFLNCIDNVTLLTGHFRHQVSINYIKLISSIQTTNSNLV